MSFEKNIDGVFDKLLWENTILCVNKLISNAISVPEGDYRVLIKDCNRCVLIPTNEASKQTFEVLRPTLAGFFNPEVHKKVISTPGECLAENR